MFTVHKGTIPIFRLLLKGSRYFLLMTDPSKKCSSSTPQNLFNLY